MSIYSVEKNLIIKIVLVSYLVVNKKLNIYALFNVVIFFFDIF